MKTKFVESIKNYYLSEPEHPCVWDIYVDEDVNKSYIKAFIFDDNQEWKEVVNIMQLDTGDVRIDYMDGIGGGIGDGTEERDYLYRLGIKTFSLY